MRKAALLFALCLYALLIFRWGYYYGVNDQVELLPYVQYVQDGSLFAEDFYIQGMERIGLNERKLLVHALSVFGQDLYWPCLILHFVFTILLILGLERLARRFIQNPLWAWLAVAINLLLLYDYALGGVSLYTPQFQATTIATALGAWALHYFLQKRYWIAFALLAAVTFVQIIQGVTLTIALGLVLLMLTMRGTVAWRKFLGVSAMYALTAGVFLVAILVARGGGDSSMSDAEYFKVLFDFRHAHHFIFAAFPLKSILVTIGLTVIGLMVYGARDVGLFRFLLIAALITVIYAIAVDGFQTIFIANLQWYKISIWMKFFGLVALFAVVQEALPVWMDSLRFRRVAIAAMVVAGIFALWMVSARPAWNPLSAEYHFGDFRQRNAEIDISIQAAELTPKDAVFIQPFELTALKYYSKRSSFVEFKANVRNKPQVEIWYDRIQQVYGIDANMEVSGFALQEAANSFYHNLEADALAALREQGVTHRIVQVRVESRSRQVQRAYQIEALP